MSQIDLDELRKRILTLKSKEKEEQIDTKLENIRIDKDWKEELGDSIYGRLI